MILTPGSRLGPYEILASIGAGGMGEVWKARDTRLNRVVAIKCLKADSAARFQQEARAIAALGHPNICQIFDVGADFLVLEFVEGSPLQGPLATAQALPLALEIASALEAAHRRGILHRDLKPANVLVTEGGAKLLDFGLAKITGEPDIDSTRTAEGTVLGTAAYMSPEQARGRPLDARSDIFSFGALLYELLSGRRAFHGDSMLETLNAVVSSEPPPLDSPLASVVRKCLAKDASERFQSAAELRAALANSPAKTERSQASIAVLPFANMSGDKDQEYFSDGLAEEILNLLTKIPGLKVTARTSSFAFRGKEQDVRKIAEALSVKTILEGSVRKSGNRIRVTAQLIDATDGSHLWSERYDRQLTDVFEVQDEIAAAIAGSLRLKLHPEGRRHTPAAPAYEEFLKARHYLRNWSVESASKARECLRRAVTLDPGFALAHTELCRVFEMMATENSLRPEEAAKLMRQSAQSASEIDPSLPSTHWVLAMAAVLDYDWKRAGEEFQLVLSHAPVPADIRIDYSLWYLAPLGRIKEAQEQMERALIDDPLSVLARAHLGGYIFLSGRSAESEAVENQAVELAPGFFIPYFHLACHQALEGRLGEARANAERCAALAPWNPGVAGALAGIVSLAGDEAQAREVMSRLGDGSAFGSPWGFVIYHGLRSECDRAADWFERMIQQRDMRAPYIAASALGDRLTSSPRWHAFRRMMNLPG
ncbi:MAG TPA: protein kinase [Bryobacteraceae bacterium]|nr:protein kinase [Bryobacteraceae bacterium]